MGLWRDLLFDFRHERRDFLTLGLCNVVVKHTKKNVIGKSAQDFVAKSAGRWQIPVLKMPARFTRFRVHLIAPGPGFFVEFLTRDSLVLGNAVSRTTIQVQNTF